MRPIARLDTLSALYHCRSSITHLIVEPVPEILAALTKAPATASQLMETLVADYGLEQDAESAAALQARLDELEAIGLVWRL